MAEETTAPGAAGDDEAAWKQARQRAATSQCYICLDDHPEVMSLCCGIPLHVNCVLDWRCITHMEKIQVK